MENISVTLGKRQLVDSIWKSAGIEGLGTTFPNTERILHNLPVETKREEVTFIVNMKRAWEFLFGSIDFPNELPILQDLNRICLTGTETENNSGQLRTVFVTIGGTSRIPALPIKDDVVAQLSAIDKMENKLESALEMACYLSRGQLFIDGNKRLANLMCNKIMMENDLGIFSVPYKRIDYYKELLVDFYETGNSSNLKDFFRQECLLRNPEPKPNHQTVLQVHLERYLHLARNSLTTCSTSKVYLFIKRVD